MTAFTRNFGPLINGGSADQNMRVSDAERQAVADRLGVHYGDGRLDQVEFDERVGRAMSAKTRGDLRGILDDLPEPGAAGAPGIQATDGRPRRSRRHPVLFIALLVILASAFTHAVFWVTMPILWLVFVVVVALALTGRIGRSRAS